MTLNLPWWSWQDSYPVNPGWQLALKSCKHRGMEQLVARQAHNLEVGGSSPSSATTVKIENHKETRELTATFNWLIYIFKVNK